MQVSISDLPDFRRLAERLETVRARVGKTNTDHEKAALGQFLTPAPVAALMASLLELNPSELRILDPGAGAGALLAAVVQAACEQPNRPRNIQVLACEMDGRIIPELRETIGSCKAICDRFGVRFEGEVRVGDFLSVAEQLLQSTDRRARRFNLAVLNPPYRKIGGDSPERQILRRLGVETSNLYAAFLAATVLLLEPGAELVAITPRSFCNGPYFRSFREWLLGRVTLCHLHGFPRRDTAFGDEKVLQENIIFRARLGPSATGMVRISSGHAAEGEVVPSSAVVRPGDPESFIRFPAGNAAALIQGQPSSLSALRLQVSTGRVVDFRAIPLLRRSAEPGTVPLLYPTHLQGGRLEWPKDGKKPNGILEEAKSLLVPNETYVLVKRVSAKEEERRVVATVYVGGSLPGAALGLENHLNYVHRDGGGLPLELAYGLAAYLNSSMVDAYFREFNGHTQVNATDLRAIPYPDETRLGRLGARWSGMGIDQRLLDAMVEEELRRS